MKQGDFCAAWGGIAGVQSTLAVLLERGHHGARPAARADRRRSWRPTPARRFRIARQGIAGGRARCRSRRWSIRRSRSRSTPAICISGTRRARTSGATFRGAVRRTIRRGETIFAGRPDHGASLGDCQPRVRAVKPAAATIAVVEHRSWAGFSRPARGDTCIISDRRAARTAEPPAADAGHVRPRAAARACARRRRSCTCSPAGGAASRSTPPSSRPAARSPRAGDQRFVYVLEGELVDRRPSAAARATTRTCRPAHASVVSATAAARAAVIEKPYQPLGSTPAPRRVHRPRARRRRRRYLGGDPWLEVRALVPDDAAFDFRVNTMTYQPGAALPVVEIHVMEHGLLMLEGGGIYRLGDALVSGRRRRLHLDGAVLPAVVRRARQASGEVPDLQGLGPAPAMSRPEVDEAAADARAGRAGGDSPTRRRRPSRASSSPRPTAAPARYVKGLCAEAGLVVREDAVGNTFARWTGAEPGAAAGRHRLAHRRDSERRPLRRHRRRARRRSRRFARCARAGFRPRRSIELVLFTSEEPTRFGIGCLGSRLLAGAARRIGRRAAEGRGRPLARTRRARRRASTDRWRPCRCGEAATRRSSSCTSNRGRCSSEAGPTSASSRRLPRRRAFAIIVEGEGGHAGAVLMPDRRDAFLAAAEIALAVERAARATGAIDTVGTVGVCEVFPGAVNSVPSRARLEVDVRDIDLAPARCGAGAHRGRMRRDRRAPRRGGAGSSRSTPTRLRAAPRPIVDAIAAACAGRAAQPPAHDQPRVSRLAVHVAHRADGMIFIPCRGGVSHRPDEYASPEAIADGTAVLADTLARLSE